MIVVHVCAYFAPAFGFGGPVRSLLTLCQAQQAAGIGVEVFTTTAGNLPSKPKGTIIGGIPARYFPLSPPARLFGASSMRAPLSAAAGEADVVHIHGLWNRTVWLAAGIARRVGTPYVVSPRGMLEPAALAHHANRKQLSFSLFERRILAHAALWHSSSRAETATLQALAAARPIVEIPNPVAPIVVTPAQVQAARARFALGDDPYILFLGRLHPIKRLDLLAAAFAAVSRTHDRARLVIAGPDDQNTRVSLEPLLAPIASRVRWTGAVDGDEKAGLTAGATALVLCSDSESFGMSVAESLAAGVPAVVTRTCPWPFLEEDGCGFWIDQTPEAIAAGLDLLLSRPDVAREMGIRGRETVRRRFGADAVARAWLQAYRRVARDVTISSGEALRLR